MSEEDFIRWLKEEIEARQWTQSEFAKQSGLAPSTVSMVLKLQKSPGTSFCKRAAAALNLPPSEVMRRAGHLPDTQAVIDEDEAFQKIIEVCRDLTPDQRQDIYEYILLYEQQSDRRERL